MTPSNFTVRSVQAFCYRYKLSTPVITSFGRMMDRPAVFVRVQDEDGYIRLGRGLVQFPATLASRHGPVPINEVLAPALLGTAANEPSEFFDKLTNGTSVLALQSGEPGPFAQAIAGIDLAIWDIYARRQKQPLWKLLGGNSSTIKVYASGINPVG